MRLLAWSIKSLLLKAAVRHIWALLLRQGPCWSVQTGNKRCHVGGKYQPTRKTVLLLLSLNAISCLNCKWEPVSQGSPQLFSFCHNHHHHHHPHPQLWRPPLSSCPGKTGNPCILQILTWLELKLCCRSKPVQAKMVIGEFSCLLLWTSSCVISVVIIIVVRHSMWYFDYQKIRLILLSDEKKKTKVVDSEVNPVWNEVTNLLTVGQTCSSVQILPWLLKSFALICDALSCLRCWNLIWRARCWTRPPALMWLWKTTRLLGKISKCASWGWACATRSCAMKETMFAGPDAITADYL